MKNRIGRVKRTAGLLLAVICLTSVLASPIYSLDQNSSYQEIVPQGSRPSWAPTGSLNTPRFSQTATLLPNGKVLITGGGVSTGSNHFVPTDSAELYDPETGTWIVTDKLKMPRYGHTATLLANGKVLVAGGLGSSGGLNSAELYNPDTGKWSDTGNLTTFRYLHTSTRLQSGKVLLVGPWNGAELYDPDTRVWSGIGGPMKDRYAHTATLLEDGSVLISGGEEADVFDNITVFDSAELYNPATGNWSATGKLKKVRSGHTATRLSNGTVLVAGGSYDSALSAELYDPVSGQWVMTGELNLISHPQTSTLLSNGNVLLTSDEYSELYDPATETWSNTAYLNTTRGSYTATLLQNGKVLVAGGTGKRGYLSSAELYDLSTFSCVGSISHQGKAFDASGGADNVDVAASAECSWIASSNARWIKISSSSNGNGNGTVSYSVAANDTTAPRASAFSVDSHVFIVTQAGALVRITRVSVVGKRLFLFGENFDPGAVILLNAEAQRTKSDDANPRSTLIGRKAGKRLKLGDRLQVRNPNGTLSEEFIFTGSL